MDRRSEACRGPCPQFASWHDAATPGGGAGHRWRVVSCEGSVSALAPHLSGDLLQRALETAQAIGDERDSAWALAALAPHLSGEKKAEALQRVLEAERNMTNGLERAFAVSAFLTSMDSSASLRATADCFRWVQSCHRRDLLDLCGKLFPIGSLDTEIMDLMFQHLIEVCYEWRWL